MLAQPFFNPHRGEMTFAEVIEDLVSDMSTHRGDRFEILIGTDSSVSQNHVDYVSAIVLHKIGRGGRYFWTRSRERRTDSLRQRIWREAWLSFELAQEVIGRLRDTTLLQFDLEIHVDVGTRGRTRELIDEVVGMIRANGFSVRIKPEAFAASSVADKHT